MQKGEQPQTQIHKTTTTKSNKRKSKKNSVSSNVSKIYNETNCVVTNLFFSCETRWRTNCHWTFTCRRYFIIHGFPFNILFLSRFSIVLSFFSFRFDLICGWTHVYDNSNIQICSSIRRILCVYVCESDENNWRVESRKQKVKNCVLCFFVVVENLLFTAMHVCFRVQGAWIKSTHRKKHN